MKKLSSKGQALVIFVIFVPVIIMVGTLIIDVGFARYNSNNLNDITKLVIRYGLKNIDSDPYNKMVDLLYQNDSDIDNYSIEIDVENKTIKMSVDKATKGFFGSIVGKEIYKEKSSYIGYIKDEKYIIEKDDLK